MGSWRNVSAGQAVQRQPVLDSYGRLSRVPETGELEKIETQWEDNRVKIERVGGVLGEELSDGLSAWKRGVRRRGWERLLERVRSGESDGIVVWHTDRLFRQPRDLEALIDLAEKGFTVYSAHGERDLANPDDRFILRIEVAHAARSSDDTSRRIKRRFATKREQGVGHIGGPPRFGWPRKDSTWVPGSGQTEEDRPMVPAVLVARERRALWEATKVMAAGVSDAVIAREWNAQGLRSAGGREWVPNTVKSVILRATNAGLVEHGGELVARMPGEPIVDPDHFDRVRAIYAARRRGRVAGEVGERYVGTGILRCGQPACGQRLSARKSRDFYRGTEQFRASYTCKKDRRGCGKVSADVRSVDVELRNLVIVRLSDSRYAAAIEAARAQVADRLTEINTEIAECEALQAALSERLGRREITLDAFDKANQPLAEDLSGLYGERDALSGGSADGPIQAQPMHVIAAQWDGADVAEKRTMLQQALGPSTLYVDRFQHTGKRVFNRDRLRLVDPDGTTVTLGSLG